MPSVPLWIEKYLQICQHLRMYLRLGFAYQWWLVCCRSSRMADHYTLTLWKCWEAAADPSLVAHSSLLRPRARCVSGSVCSDYSLIHPGRKTFSVGLNCYSSLVHPGWWERPQGKREGGCKLHHVQLNCEENVVLSKIEVQIEKPQDCGCQYFWIL